MFTKIMGKRASRKPSKSDPNEPAVFHLSANSSSGHFVTASVSNPTSISTSNVTVNNNVIRSNAATQVGGDRVLATTPSSAGAIELLPLFREVPVSDRQNLFTRKLQICSIIFDFSDTFKFVREKETKRQTLLELIDFIQSGSGKMTESMQEELIRMISVNIFRCLPPASYENTGSDNADPEEEDTFLEPSWPHLQIVYDLLLRYVVSSDTDTKIAKRYIDHSFVLKLLDLFDSEDMRERDYLKTILHRIYGKFMVHRPFIRKAINNIFYRFIFETERHSGIGELLEILGSIINGFALPMKEEHKLFLVRALIPLHKPKSVAVYHQQLSYCITQFVEKDYKLADIVIRGLLKCWPVINCQKEVLFLNELEEVLEATQSAEFQRCMVPLFRQIGRCLNSSHFQKVQWFGNLVWLLHKKYVENLALLQFPPLEGLWLEGLATACVSTGTDQLSGESSMKKQLDLLFRWFFRSIPGSLIMIMLAILTQVAERALFLWNNDHVVSLIAQNRSVIFPIIFEALEKNIQSHWNQAVHGLTLNVRKMFLEMDNELFLECERQYLEKEANAKELEEQRELMWKKMEAEIAAKSRNEEMVLVN